MRCDEARELFLGYQEGDLDAGTRRDLEAHLAGCPSCTAEWQEYRRTVDEVSGLLQIPPPEDFVSRVKQTIGRRSRGRFFGGGGPFSVSFAIVSFVLILLIMLAYLVMTTGTSIEVVGEEVDAGGELSAPGSGAGAGPPPPAPL